MMYKLKKFLKWYFYTMLFAVGIFLVYTPAHATVLMNTIETVHTTSSYASPPNWYFVVKPSSTLVTVTTGTLYIKIYGDPSVPNWGPSGRQFLFQDGASWPGDGATEGTWRNCTATSTAADGGFVCEYVPGTNVYGKPSTPDILNATDTIEFQQNNFFTAPRTGAITRTWSAGSNEEVFDIQACIATASSDVSGVGCPSINPPSTFPDATFAFPSSTYLGPAFSNWVINFNPNDTSTQTYFLQVQFYNSVIGTSSPFSSITSNYSSVVTNTSTLWSFPLTGNSLFNYDNNNVASTTWSATLFVSTSSVQNWTETDFVTFGIEPNAPSSAVQIADATLAGPFFWNAIQDTPTWYPQTIASSSAYLAGQCVPASDWTDIGGGLNYAGCSIVNYLFVSSPGATQNLSNAFNNLKTVPPLSWLLGTTDVLTVAISSTASTADLTFENFPETANGQITGTSTLVVAGPNQNPTSTQLGIIFLNVKNAWFNLVMALFILLLFIVGFKILKRT